LPVTVSPGTFPTQLALATPPSFRRRLQFQELRPVLCVGRFETRDVLHQALGGQAKEIITELGFWK
jgi:hypothetical protein